MGSAAKTLRQPIAQGTMTLRLADWKGEGEKIGNGMVTGNA